MVPQSSATGKTAKNCPKKGISLRPRLHQPHQKLSDGNLQENPMAWIQGSKDCGSLSALAPPLSTTRLHHMQAEVFPPFQARGHQSRLLQWNMEGSESCKRRKHMLSNAVTDEETQITRCEVNQGEMHNNGNRGYLKDACGCSGSA